MANQIPELLANFMVYLEDQILVGVADVELPKLESMTEKVSGAGLAGEIESPVAGHYSAMTTKIKFRTVTSEAVGKLAAPSAHRLDFRGAQQVLVDGALKTASVRVTVKATPKSVDLGKFEVGKPTDTADEFAVSYLKIYVDGKEIVEVDPVNFVAKFNGVDVLGDTKKALGL